MGQRAKQDSGDILKIGVWITNVQAAAVYGLEVLHINRSLLLRARAWEHTLLRKIFSARRLPSETPEAHAKRAARHIGSVFARAQAPRLHTRILHEVLRSDKTSDPDLLSLRTEMG